MEILLIAIVIGCIPGAIAQSKGYSFVLWWLYGAALFVVALPHSLFLRERDRPRVPIPVVIAEGMTTRPVYSGPANASSGAAPRVVAVPVGHAAPATTKTCPMCAETVQAAARICRFCRHEFPEPAPLIEAARISPVLDAPPRRRLGHVPFGMKQCPSCQTHNWHDAATCKSCGTTFALATPPRPDRA